MAGVGLAAAPVVVVVPLSSPQAKRMIANETAHPIRKFMRPTLSHTKKVQMILPEVSEPAPSEHRRAIGAGYGEPHVRPLGGLKAGVLVHVAMASSSAKPGDAPLSPAHALAHSDFRGMGQALMHAMSFTQSAFAAHVFCSVQQAWSSAV